MSIKKLHILILRAFVGPFGAGFSVSLFILVLQFISRYKDDIFGKGFSSEVIAQLFLYATIPLIVIALPLAILIASLMTLGKMGENYELAAIKASGINLFRVLFPLGISCGLIFLLSGYLSWYTIPKANLKLYSLLYDVQHTKPAFALKPGLFNNFIDGYSIRIAERDPKTGLLYNVMIYDHSSNRGNTKVTLADSATMTMDSKLLYLRMNLFHGSQNEEPEPEMKGPNSFVYTRIYFDTLNYKLDMSGFGLKRTAEQLFSSHQYMLTYPELSVAIDSFKQKGTPLLLEDFEKQFNPTLRLNERLFSTKNKSYTLPSSSADSNQFISSDLYRRQLNEVLGNARNARNIVEFNTNRIKHYFEEIRKYEIEKLYKLTMPMACIIFLFIGAPLGAIIRKGSLGVPIVVSVVFFILFYVLMTQGRKLAREDVIPVWVGVWLPILAMSPIAIYLSYQAATDSKLLDINSWTSLFKRIGSRLKKH